VLLEAKARPDIIIAATHGLLLAGSREKLSGNGIGRVFVTDTVNVSYEGWPQLQVVSVASVFASALQRFMADRSIGDLF
jgi:ribose-phosphate pyrophosphokinase